MRTLAMIFVFAAGIVVPAVGADVPGSRDHPQIDMRYPEAELTAYKETAFDEYRLLTGQVAADKQPTATKTLEGKITNITYIIPAERSTLEVMRNYEIALEQLGFHTLFKCSDDTCGGRAFNHVVIPYISGFGDNYEDQRFYAGKLDRPEGSVYASLYIVKNFMDHGINHNKVCVRLDVIETKAMDVGMKVIKAEEMQSQIEQTGRVAIHSILFAFDSADILPESRPSLDEISKLLKSSTDVRLYVVGHTDDQGTLEYNLDLSRRRAAAVVKDLVNSYGIDAGRLAPQGLAFLAPVATNRTEEGRQQNRRVELVPQTQRH